MSINEIETRVSAALALLRDEIDAAHFYPRNNCELDRTLLMIAAKAIRIAEAVCLLVRDGFYGEAFGLFRSCLEAFLIAKYIANTAKDPEGRVASYINFAKVHLYNQDNIRKRHFSHIESHITQEWLDDAAAFPNKRCWEAAHNMAMERFVHPREVNSPSGGFQADTDYDCWYEHASHYVHVGSLSLTPYASRGGEIFKVAKRDTEETLGLLALNSLSYVYMVCIIAEWQFDTDISAETRRQIESLLKDLQAALRQYKIVIERKADVT